MKMRVWTIAVLFLALSLTGCSSKTQNTGVNSQEANTPVLTSSTKDQQAQAPGDQKTQIIMVGDADNLGHNWLENADKFSGQKIPSDKPIPGPAEEQGTDQIMVGSSYTGQAKKHDGFCATSTRPQNSPRPLQFKFNYTAKGFSRAQIGIYAVDLQPQEMGSHFTVTLDGRPAPFIEQKLNSVDQTGARGQFLSFDIPAEFLDLLNDGQLEVLIDDIQTGAGDGYIIDFARLTLEANQ